MTRYRFTLVIEGAKVFTQRNLDALYEAGCDDAVFGESDGVQTADVGREAASFAEALADVVGAIESAVPGSRVVAVTRHDELVAGG